MNNSFDIKIIDLHWIKNIDDPQDLCAHGHIYIKIGDKIVSNKESGDWTLSSTALYLMRTIHANYKKDDFASVLVPCCGHFFMADDKEEFVSIMGCGNGIDWTKRNSGRQLRQEGLFDFLEGMAKATRP